MQRIQYELGKKDLYDYAVINDDLEETVVKIENIIKAVKNG
jgi:guanylate kinase